MKLKKKLKKIIAILSVVVIAFSCFIVNVSAAGSTGTIYSIPMNQPTADEYSGYIECRYRNTSNGNIIPVVYFWRVYPRLLEYSTDDPNSGKSPVVYVTVSDTGGVDLQVNMVNQYGSTSGVETRFSVSYGRVLGNNGYIYYNSDTNTKIGDNGTVFNSTIVVDLYLDPGFEIYGFKLYGNAILDSAYSGYNTESLFTFQYSETSVLYESILAMANSLGSSTQQITQNADKNAAQIQQNQDSNTNKVINGGTENPHYNKTDTTVTDDYKSKEDALNSQTFQARESTVSMFNNFGSLIDRAKLTKGLLAVSNLMSQVLSIGWVADLVQFALVLGAFAFVIGTATFVIGRISSNEKSKQRQNETRSYRRARMEYWSSRRKK